MRARAGFGRTSFEMRYWMETPRFADAWDVDLSSPDGVGKGYAAWLEERVAEADPNYKGTIEET